MGADSEAFSRHVDCGEVLFREGDPADHAYLLEAGRLEVSVERSGHHLVLAEVGPGSLVGEMSLIDHGTRAGTVIALEPSTVQRLERSQVDERLRVADPFVRHMLQLMVVRYRNVLQRLGGVGRESGAGFSLEGVGDDSRALDRVRAEQALHHALDEKQFVLHYQPIMRLEDASVAGFEALIRWQHPQRGMVRPEAFIPIAEESGLIVPMGHWIIDSAISAVAQFDAALPHRACGAPLFMTINISARQFEDPALTSVLKDALCRNNVDPARIKLEITESSLVNKISKAAAVMGECANLGMKLAVDDFGTGYSSLSYLYRLPVSSVKLARPFIRDLTRYPGSGKVVGAVARLGRELGMETIAEGIEQQHHANSLRALSIEYGQGYYYASAMPLRVASRFVEETLKSSAAAVRGRNRTPSRTHR